MVRGMLRRYLPVVGFKREASPFKDKEAVEVEPGKWWSVDGKWQHRVKDGDVTKNHIHLEELNPKTGQVLQNLHLRWPESFGR
jgi:hypothetical protein